MKSEAIIFGVTGQDGSYLAEYLIERGNIVYGVTRRSSTNTTRERLYNILDNPNFILIEGDVTDYASVFNVFRNIYSPTNTKVFNLSAQSHVGESFNQPIYTFNVDAIGVLNILEIIKQFYPGVRFYQASTSEMFGNNSDVDGFQREDTPFMPTSPYAIAKVAAHNLVQLYRRYGIFACSGILFNHESPRRGENFVTRKVTKYVGTLYDDLNFNRDISPLKLGNLKSCRDWGHAKDYVKAMVLMLEADAPDDYIIATGKTHSIEELCELAFGCIGIKNWRDYVVADDPNCVRPSDLIYLKGDSSKARKLLGWSPNYTFKDLIKEMVSNDIARI